VRSAAGPQLLAQQHAAAGGAPPELEAPGGVLLLVLQLQLLPLVHQLAAHGGCQLLELLLVDVVGQHLQQALALAAAGARLGACPVLLLAGPLLLLAASLLVLVRLLQVVIPILGCARRGGQADDGEPAAGDLVSHQQVMGAPIDRTFQFVVAGVLLRLFGRPAAPPLGLCLRQDGDAAGNWQQEGDGVPLRCGQSRESPSHLVVCVIRGLQRVAVKALREHPLLGHRALLSANNI
jgi:hypothetical protein